MMNYHPDLGLVLELTSNQYGMILSAWGRGYMAVCTGDHKDVEHLISEGLMERMGKACVRLTPKMRGILDARLEAERKGKL